jgi:uncharacterized protein (UPF0332 family)/predicted nucleotidyltransferase
MNNDKLKGLEPKNGVPYIPNSLAGMPQMVKQDKPRMTPESFEALKTKLESFKKVVLKKYKFTMALLVLPEPTFPLFEEDEMLPKEVVDSKPIHMIMVIPEEEYKNIPKIKPEVLKMLKDTGENIWLYLKTPVDLWNYGLDSKYEFLDAVSTSFPVYDNGFIGALRVANIHKSLVLRKFEKYVASYVIGGSLVRGTAIETSDVDTFVIIDDTDVKRMSRVELLEKLRGIIYDYIKEATALAGVKNVLSVQVWLLTDFWQRVKDAEPVAFTFIRDGIPLYDRGTFLPWKLLLKMGKIKPSPEAVDMFMKTGDQTTEMINRRMIDAMIDVYYGVLTPAQAMMMLAGYAPPTHKEAPRMFKETFYDKEKLVDIKYVNILEKVVRLFKEYEHGKLKTISGKEVDILVKECEDFNKMIKELRKKLEARLLVQMVAKSHDETINLLKNIFGNKSKDALIKDLDKQLIKTGKLSPRMLNIAKTMANINVKDNKKASASEAQKISGDASELIESLVEYSQRKDIIKAEKGVIQIAYSGRKAELVIADKEVFIVEFNSVKKLINGKLVESNKKELEEATVKMKDKLQTKIPSSLIEDLRNAIGDFEISL